MSESYIGFSERITKTVIVKRKGPRKAWTNRTTKTTEKWCKKHQQVCVFSEKAVRCKQTRREDYMRSKSKSREKSNVTSKMCRVCKKNKLATCFYKNPKCKDGFSNICKPCKKEYDRNRNNTWNVLIRVQWRASLGAHGNKEEINPMSHKECEKLLHEQNYKCNHYKVQLKPIQGTQVKCSWERASLDRINTNIVGYGNGNAQWLCVSCNKGKCTMPDEVHKEKFASRDRKICELEDEIDKLKKKLKMLKV